MTEPAAGDPPLVDAHVHLLGIGDTDSGIWINPRFRLSLHFLGMGLFLGMHWRKLSGDSYDGYYLKLLLEDIRSSPLDFAVVQGLDGVYDAEGRLDRGRTPLYVPNEYVYRTCREHPELVPAATVNPARADWAEQLEMAAAEGAACVKIHPCVSGVDTSDRRWLPYYHKLRELGLVLMVHTGPERAAPSYGHELGDPARLELPLAEGLTVIAAHAGTADRRDRFPFFENMVALMERYDRLYADSSDVAQPHRWKWLGRLAENELVRSRLLHGSDYPIPCLPLPWGVLDFGSWWRVRKLRSYIARDLAVKETAGFGRESAVRAAAVLAGEGKALWCRTTVQRATGCP